MSDETDQRISIRTAAAMLTIALFLYFLKLLVELTFVGLFISWIFMFIEIVGFGAWFAFKHVNFFGGKQVTWKLGSLFLGIPLSFIPLFPAFFIAVLTTILAVRREDTEKAMAEQQAAGPAVRFGPQKIAANDNGVMGGSEAEEYQEAA